MRLRAKSVLTKIKRICAQSGRHKNNPIDTFSFRMRSARGPYNTRMPPAGVRLGNRDSNVTLTVVIGTHNRKGNLINLIESIYRSAGTKVHIFVSDAASTDGTREYLANNSHLFTRIYLKSEKRGQIPDLNEMLLDVQTPYLTWLSDDNELTQTGFVSAIKSLERNPKLGLIGLKTKDVSGEFAKFPYIGGLSELGILNVNQGIIRTGLLRSLGGFDSDYPGYGMDPDLVAKCLRAGFQVAYTKRIALKHYRMWPHEGTLDRANLEDRFELGRKLYLDKHRYFFENLEKYSEEKSKSTVKLLLSRAYGSCGLYRYSFARTLYNIVNCPFISFFDPAKNVFKSYHLVQDVSKKRTKYGHDKK